MLLGTLCLLIFSYISLCGRYFFFIFYFFWFLIGKYVYNYRTMIRTIDIVQYLYIFNSIHVVLINKTIVNSPATLSSVLLRMSSIPPSVSNKFGIPLSPHVNKPIIKASIKCISFLFGKPRLNFSWFWFPQINFIMSYIEISNYYGHLFFS